MKTGCTDELIHQIADVTAFSKMRIAKSAPDAKARLMVKTVCVVYVVIFLIYHIFQNLKMQHFGHLGGIVCSSTPTAP